VQRVDGGLVFVDPKTNRARRQITLPATALEPLRQHRRDQTERRLLVGPHWQDLDLVCDRGDGGPLHPDSWSKAFKRLALKAGLPGGTRLHDVRHGFATVLLASGVHPAIASAALGHASPAFTMTVYQHVLDGMTAQAAAAIDEAFAEFR
jgi:integrase